MRKLLLVWYVVPLLAGCGGSASDANTPTDPPTQQPPPEAPPPVGDAAVVADSASGSGPVTTYLRNTGGPGTYAIEFYGLPTSPNGPDTYFGRTEPVDVPTGYKEKVTWQVATDLSDPPVTYLLIFTRNQGSATYRQTSRCEFPVFETDPPPACASS